MAVIKPFPCIRPEKTVADQVAALPYDVYNRAEAKAAVAGKPLSFLNIDRPETQFEDGKDMYAADVYDKARELLEARIADGTFVNDTAASYYVYELIMDGRSQTGIVACASIDDYCNNVIMKHENTREEKEQDRIRHVDICSAQTGPIFLAYRSNDVISAIVNETKKSAPLYAFTADDGIVHIDSENFQGNAVVNYTSAEVPYTRIIEHKHFEFGSQPKTVISREYSATWKLGDEPYYPINDEKNNQLYEKYEELSKNQDKVLFGGRLGKYKYYDMHIVIKEALKLVSEKL